MEKVVKEGLKIDLHIHSCFSATKDKDKVKDGTKENLPVLIAALNENEVNVCAITDHDNFNYELYAEVKKQEGVGSIKKVLPGIEFSVLFSNGAEEKDIHIVTIFDDKDDKKIQKLETLVAESKGEKGFNKEKKAYTEDGYVAFLRAAGTDVVTIAHQKNSITSERGSQKTNVMALGKEKFDELLFIDYFDSYEFRNKQNEIFNKDYIWKNKLSDKLRFVTGSDCHEWSKYTEEAKTFNYTYIKALPTFRGLAMAMTDSERIKFENNSFFNPNAKYCKEIKVEINGEEISIPLSRGLNAIIGDNSVGKSLFLHALTKYYKVPNTKIVTGYNKYLNENGVAIITDIAPDDIFMFNTQGEIKKIFDEGLSTSDFLKKFYPARINAERYKKIVETELERFYSAIQEKFEYDNMEKKLQSFIIPSKDHVPKSLSFTESVKKENVKDLKDLCDNLQDLLDAIKAVAKISILEEEDRKFIVGYEGTLKILLKKYEDKLAIKKKENSRINIYNTYMNHYKSDYDKRTSDEHKIYADFLQSKENAINEISVLVREQKKRQKFEFAIEEWDVIPERNLVGQYAFVSKIGIERVDNDYLKALCKKVLRKDREIDTCTITENELRSIILRCSDDVENPLEELKLRIAKLVKDDFTVKIAVNIADKDVFREFSTGLNSQIYFALLSGDKRDKGIYIIDQPEDHVSQKSIRENVLDQFREMGRTRQVIFVTHNPQFIVNLDVDNVIFLSNNDGKFKIQSGALEYENDEYKILKIIADNIDGGLETIKGRLKRYAKEDGTTL